MANGKNKNTTSLTRQVGVECGANCAEMLTLIAVVLTVPFSIVAVAAKIFDSN